MKKALSAIVLSLIISSSVFCQTKSDTVVVIERSDTVAVMLVYYGEKNNVKYQEGYRIRKGLWSRSFQNGWGQYTDKFYDDRWNEFTKELVAVNPRRKKK